MLWRVSVHDVQTVHDGPAALQAALDYRPDVVLLDSGMTELNGYRVSKRLRSQRRFGSLVLVALTGFGQDEDQQRS